MEVRRKKDESTQKDKEEKKEKMKKKECKMKEENVGETSSSEDMRLTDLPLHGGQLIAQLRDLLRCVHIRASARLDRILRARNYRFN